MRRYYSTDAIKRIRLAKSYRELLIVAIDVLDVMRDQKPWKHIAMVCGPITTGGRGSRDENLKVFSRAIAKLSADGLLVFSQMPFEDSMGEDISIRSVSSGVTAS